MKKKIAFFIDSLGGGGAERVVSVISNELVSRGYDVDILMLNKRPIAYQLSNKINLYYAADMPVTTVYGKVIRNCTDKWSYIRRRFYIPLLRRIGVTTYPKWNETKIYYYANYAMPYREYLIKNEGCVALGFLIRSNISMLMAARGKNVNVKTVFCERNNPIRPDIPSNIISIRDQVYNQCNVAVFQTEEEKEYYTKLNCRTAIIMNPIKEGLPDRFEGIRRHEIVNFCRLNEQKNIPLLIEAFAMLHEEYSDYTLKIYGKGTEKEILLHLIREKKLEEFAFIEDFRDNIHEIIYDAAMFVSTSDYEGLSNSMLEAMAIGLPCICTDCDGGGARMMIKDHVSGLLIPKGDVRAVYLAMKEVIDSPELAKKLSEEGIKIREQLSVQKIIERWMEVIE